jgi:hypothetical protein
MPVVAITLTRLDADSDVHHDHRQIETRERSLVLSVRVTRDPSGHDRLHFEICAGQPCDGINNSGCLHPPDAVEVEVDRQDTRRIDLVDYAAPTPASTPHKFPSRSWTRRQRATAPAVLTIGLLVGFAVLNSPRLGGPHTPNTATAPPTCGTNPWLIADRALVTSDAPITC